MTTLPLRFTRPTAEMPTRAHPTDAGLDLSAAEDVTIHGDDIFTIGTGVAVAIPEGHVGLLFGRSSLPNTYGIQLANGVGVIDPDYRGEIIVWLLNTSQEPRTISRHERIAQLVLAPILRPLVTPVDDLDDTSRGDGGFGHTGKV